MLRSVALAALFAFSTLGCGQKSQIDRKPIYGNIVGADGRNGVVTFIPIHTSIGPAVTRSFKEGAYRFTKDDGPVPGKYNVTIKLVDSSPAATQNGRGAVKRTRNSKTASEGGRLAYEPAKTTTVSVSADGPFKIDLHPIESASQ